MDNLTMREIRAKAYKIFPDKDEEARAKAEGALKYLEHLGVVTKTDVSQWPALAVLTGPKGGLLTERTAINRQFFQWKEQAGEAEKTPTQMIAEMTARKICRNLSILENTNKTGLKRTFEENIKQANVYQNEMKGYLKRAQTASFKLAQMDDDGDGFNQDLVNSIQRLVDEGKYTIPDKQPEDGIVLITTPIIKTFFNKKQATTTTVPLGQYLVEYKMAGQVPNIYGHKDNVEAAGRIHPHLHGYGLCMGEAGVAFNKAAATFNWYAMFDAIYDILANFEEQDGYTPLYRFEEAYRKKVGAPADPPPVMKNKKPAVKAKRVEDDDDDGEYDDDEAEEDEDGEEGFF